MYHYIIGKLISAEENLAVVEAGGIGYELTVSTRSAAALANSGGTVKIYTVLNVREDDISLFGFADKHEKDFYIMLTSVSGIGPKVAIQVLSNASPEAIMRDIASGSAAQLSKYKGIGKKTAERMIVELRDKIGAEISLNEANYGTMPVITSVNEEAVAALMSLGYTKQEATASVVKVQKEDMSVEQIIMQALKGV